MALPESKYVVKTSALGMPLVSDGLFGGITPKLQTAFFDVVAGRIAAFESWLFKV